MAGKISPRKKGKGGKQFQEFILIDTYSVSRLLIGLEQPDMEPLIITVTDNRVDSDERSDFTHLDARFEGLDTPLVLDAPPEASTGLPFSPWDSILAEEPEGFALTDDIFLHPDFSSPSDNGYPMAVTIDPGFAFGDGRHATTLLCVKYLARHLGRLALGQRKALALLDAGTGTGILAIIAAKLGVGRVDAIDLNRPAVESAAENIRRNGCETIILSQSDIAEYDPGMDYDVVLANLVSDIIILNIGKLVSLVRPGGVLIASGISGMHNEEVRNHFRGHGLVPLDFSEKDGWYGYVLKRQ